MWTVEQQALGTQDPSGSSVPQDAMANLKDIQRLKSTLINPACFESFHKRVKLPIKETESVSSRPCMLATAVERGDDKEIPPIHCDDPGIVCLARNPSGRVGYRECDQGVAVVVHPRVVAKPIVGHDCSVTIRLECSCWLGWDFFGVGFKSHLYPVAVSIFIRCHSA